MSMIYVPRPPYVPPVLQLLLEEALKSKFLLKGYIDRRGDNGKDVNWIAVKNVSHVASAVGRGGGLGGGGSGLFEPVNLCL